MILTVKCANCGAVLDIKHSNVSNLGDLTVEVATCTKIGCYNCTGCEEAENAASSDNTISKLKSRIKKLKRKIKNK